MMDGSSYANRLPIGNRVALRFSLCCCTFQPSVLLYIHPIFFPNIPCCSIYLGIEETIKGCTAAKLKAFYK